MFNTRRRSVSTKLKFFIGIPVAILIYLFFFGRFQTYEQSEIIKNAKPVAVWEFVADFSKMKQLNPTILDFKILSDHGNYEDWKYTVEFLEQLSHWPYWQNTINGNFHVRKVLKDQKNLFLVESTHKVCFFKFFCLKSTGEFQIKEFNADDTHVTEIVKYQCPPFVSAFCRREVEYQRKKIMQNLTYHFAQLHRHHEMKILE
ncbi:uncharacterized protein [Chironomus tepperi]|uniref:uncharacterized protein n=1 Tax=Chironomus tepperi TaxID=113505 RepID=UPI00391FAC54